MDQLFCTACGHHLGSDDLFCTACGARVTAAEAQVPVADDATAVRRAVPAQPVRRKRSRARFWGWVAAAAVVVGAASYGLGTVADGSDERPTAGATRSTGAGSGTEGSTTSAPTTGPASPAASLDPQALAQARALHTLIAHSATDKQRIAAAAAQLRDCRHLQQAIQTFEDAADSRDRLVDQAAGLQVGLLPGGGAAVASFSQAERAAADADRAYVAYGQARHKVRREVHEHGHHGHGDRHGHPQVEVSCRGGTDELHEAVRLSSASHAPKQATAQAWNIVAAQFGLSRVTWSSL